MNNRPLNQYPVFGPTPGEWPIKPKVDGPVITDGRFFTITGTPTDKATLAPVLTSKLHAYNFLESALSEMKDRASQRDTSTTSEEVPGERSMASTVKAFNALTGHSLTEAEGWEFMILLKLVRGRQGAFRKDDYIDAAAYSALLGECASLNRKDP